MELLLRIEPLLEALAAVKAAFLLLWCEKLLQMATSELLLQLA